MRSMQTRRRIVLALAGLALPLAAQGQQKARPTPKVFRIGVLEPTSERANRENYEHFRDGLRDLGYIEEKNVVIEYRSADGRGERFPDLVAELVNLKTDLFVVRGTPAALAARRAASAPVVMVAVADPVGAGLVKSLDKPGGHVTGLATLTNQVVAQRLALLRELLPAATRLGHLVNMSNPASAAQFHEAVSSGKKLGLELVQLDVREPQDFSRVFDSASEQKVQGLIVNVDGLILEHRRLVAELAAKYRLPAVYADRDFVAVGGLLSYGVYYPHLYYRAAGYVGRILRGAKPAELPVETPTRFYLVVNRRTARSLDLELPASILQRADRVIG